MRRVVVTGMGAVTPIGIGVENFWNSVKEKRTGFDKITKFDTTGFKASLAAEIKDFDPKEFMDFKAARRMELFCQYAVAAAAEAMKNAGIDMEKEDPYRVGCYVGSGIGSLQAMEREHKRLLERGASRINPLLVPLMISNMACGNVSIQLGLKGKSLNVVTACATGTHSIGEAFRSIQIGDADVIVAGGTEAAICPMGVGGFSALTALSSATDPKRCSIPFDKDRSGFVMGEGAGVTGVVMSSNTVDIYNPKTIRSTMGSIFRVPFVYVQDFSDAVSQCQNAGIKVYAAHLDGKNTYLGEDYREGTAFLIGNEGNGLTDDITKQADTLIRIPMQGEVESLNAAIACTILTYEAVRQRSV